MTDLVTRIAENLDAVRQRMAEAARRAGRSPEDVTLVAVTKYVDLPEIRAIVAAGCTQLGESRPQQLWQRATELADLPIRWHLIGHLQRNKVRKTLPLTAMVHSIDSQRLAAAVDEEAASLGCRVPVLLEVNISGEQAKHGFTADELQRCLPTLAARPNLEIRGLMCMAGLDGGPEDAHREFASLRHLRDRLAASCPANVSLRELSMGMSGDFEIAIEEGATIVRVGSALFEGIGD